MFDLNYNEINKNHNKNNVNFLSNSNKNIFYNLNKTNFNNNNKNNIKNARNIFINNNNKKLKIKFIEKTIEKEEKKEKNFLNDFKIIRK